MKTREPLQIWIDNILKTYAAASEADKAEGLAWYPRARLYAVDLAARYARPARNVAGMIAALSPMVSWERNITDAENLLRLGARARVATYKANKRKALKILAGAEPLKNLGRFKTLSFFRCIENDRLEVCIDRHAGAIAYGRPLTNQERNTLKGPLYERLQNAYRRAALSLNLKPSELQAITWVYWRNREVQK